MSSSRLVWPGGVVAVIGGLMWVVKGMSILLTGYQPPLVLEVPMLLFAVALLGLGARLGELRGSLGTAGLIVAYVAGTSAIVALVTERALFIAMAGFGPFLGLILLGSATLQARIFPLP